MQDFLSQKTLVDKYSIRDVQECIDKIGRAGWNFFNLGLDLRFLADVAQPGLAEVHSLHGTRIGNLRVEPQALFRD